jgi:putative transposase
MTMTVLDRALLLADLGAQSHSRPHVSNDTHIPKRSSDTEVPAGFPTRFSSIEASRAHCYEFIPWYNDEHRHGGFGLHTAADVH